MRIILLGPPGCGKGTQGDLVEKRFGYPKVSTGDILRRAVADRTPLGIRAETLMNKGFLVNDEIVIGLVGERISRPDCREGYVLDGFPRNIFQAQGLEEMDPGRREIVIEIKVDEAALINRLESRRVCSGCGAVYNLKFYRPAQDGVCEACGGVFSRREDDRAEVIAERLRVYKEQTEKLVDYYLKKGVYHGVGGEGTVEDVFGRIAALLNDGAGKAGENRARP